MIILPDVRSYLNSFIDKESKNVLLIFPTPRLKTIYKMHCFPKQNEILVCFLGDNVSIKLDGVRFKEYKFMGFDEVETIRRRMLEKIEHDVLNGNSEKEPIGLLDTIKKNQKPVKFKPKNKKHKYTGFQEHHIIVDELHEWSGKDKKINGR